MAIERTVPSSPQLEGTDCSEHSMETTEGNLQFVQDGLVYNNNGSPSSPCKTMNRDVTNKTVGDKPTIAAADIDWWTSPTALSVYFVACVAIFSANPWILRALMTFLVYKMARVVGKWIHFFWHSPELAEIVRMTKLYTGILKRQGERTLEGGGNRRYMEGAALYGAKIGKSHVMNFVSGKFDELNQGMVDEMRSRHIDSPQKGSS